MRSLSWKKRTPRKCMNHIPFLCNYYGDIFFLVLMLVGAFFRLNFDDGKTNELIHNDKKLEFIDNKLT